MIRLLCTSIKETLRLAINRVILLTAQDPTRFMLQGRMASVLDGSVDTTTLLDTQNILNERESLN